MTISSGGSLQNSPQQINQRLTNTIQRILIGAASLGVVIATIWLLDQGALKRFFDLRSSTDGRELSDRAWQLLVLIGIAVAGSIWMINSLRRRIALWRTSLIVLGIFAVAYMLGRTSLQLDYDFLLLSDLVTTMTTWAAFGLLLIPLVGAGAIGYWLAKTR